MKPIGRIVAWIALTPIAVLVASIGGCEARKAYYDWEVRRMCETDGGVTVFDRVVLDKSEYEGLGGSHGQIPVPEERSAAAGEPYVSSTTRKVLKEDSIRITRTESHIKRRVDGKVLARYVTYSRVGGDFPSWAHPSYIMCDLPGGNVSQQVFIVRGGVK
jgi:hypothetical protein